MCACTAESFGVSQHIVHPDCLSSSLEFMIRKSFSLQHIVLNQLCRLIVAGRARTHQNLSRVHTETRPRVGAFNLGNGDLM